MSRDEVPAGIDGRRGAGIRTVLVLGLIAFVAGLVAMASLVRTRPGWFGMAAPREVMALPANPVPAQAAMQPTASSPQQDLLANNNALAEAAARESALAARLADLEARLSETDVRAANASGNAARAEGLLVAFAARRALDHGLGLAYLEGQLRDRFGHSQPRAVAVVIGAARNPITLEELQIGFDELAPTLTTAPASEGWWTAIRREFAGMVVLRREGTPSPRPSDRLARARRKLEGGQVDGALAEIMRLPGAEQATPWIAAAKRYIQARRALDVVETSALLQPRNAALAAPAPPAEVPPPMPVQ